MSAGRIIGYIIAAIAIVFGFLFVLGAFSPQGSSGWLIVGAIGIAFGFGVIWLASRSGKTASGANDQGVTLNIDLPGDVDIERFECQNCGSPLSIDNIKMVAGAPMVSCPYCDAAYQLTEKPKW